MNCPTCGNTRAYWNGLLQEWRPCIDCNEDGKLPATIKARSGIEAQNGLNDIFSGDDYPIDFARHGHTPS